MTRAFFEKISVRLIGCLMLGALGALSMPPFYSPALILSLSGFWLLLTGFPKKWHAPAAGFLFGFGYFVAGIWWVGNALLVGGNPYLWALPLAVSGLQAILALFTMMGALCSQWFYKGRTLGAYLFFLAMMGFWEWARGNFFTGFPWNLFGMAWTPNLSVLQILSVGGIYFLSLLSIFMFSVPAFVWKGEATKKTRYLSLGLALILLTGLWVWGHDRLARLPTVYNRDVIVQVVTPDIPQNEKWDPSLFWNNYTKTLRGMAPAQMDGSITGKTRFIVLPETAFTYTALADPNAAHELTRILKMYSEKTYLLTGMLRRTADPATGDDLYHNSLVGYDQSLKDLFDFDKFHLVPFGEYVPFQKYIPLGPVIDFANFARGAGPRTVSLGNAPPFSPLVCYEVIFPGHVVAGERPEWLVNITNDAWYGISPGPYQHLGHTVYRAIEEGLPMIRSTNTGISAIIDPQGRILNQSGLFTPSVQTLNLPKPAKPTFYSVYKELLFFMSLIFLIFGSAILRRRRINNM